MNLTLSNATFTAARGCRIHINSLGGFMADIETKPALLQQGVCSITALSLQDHDKAEALMISPCGQDGTVFGCPDPRLVELAARYKAWMDDDQNAPWNDTAAAPLEPLAAAMALQGLCRSYPASFELMNPAFRKGYPLGVKARAIAFHDELKPGDDLCVEGHRRFHLFSVAIMQGRFKAPIFSTHFRTRYRVPLPEPSRSSFFIPRSFRTMASTVRAG